MSSKQKNGATDESDHDYETYKLLLHLWQSENPIKTIKLQFLLAVNALLISAVAVSGRFGRDLWYVYAAGMIFNLIWTFSIGRTSLFQDAWRARLLALQERYPDDSRFSVLDSGRYRRQARWLSRTLGAIPSRWYLLLAPLAFAAVWLVVLAVTR
jgi:hypothetical protein